MLEALALWLAFPEGKRAEMQIRSLFDKADMSIPRDPTQPRVRLENSGSERPDGFTFMRPRDISRQVELEKFDVGFPGLDRYLDSRANVELVTRLPYDNEGDKVELVLVCAPDDLCDVTEIKTPIISEYVECTRTYLAGKHVYVEVEGCSGGAERLVPYPYKYAVCVKETGRTLEEYGLVVLDTIFETMPVMIASRSAMRNPRKAGQIYHLRDALLEQCTAGAL